MNEIVKITPAEQFRAEAASRLVDVASMTLHQLVDEFQRLTEIMDKDTTIKEGYGRDLGEAGELACRERRLVVGASRARFGISFEAFDRTSSSEGYDW